jgi:hypothetical protein
VASLIRFDVLLRGLQVPALALVRVQQLVVLPQQRLVLGQQLVVRLA